MLLCSLWRVASGTSTSGYLPNFWARRTSASIRLECLATGAHECERLANDLGSVGENRTRDLLSVSSVLTTTPPNHTFNVFLPIVNYAIRCSQSRRWWRSAEWGRQIMNLCDAVQLFSEAGGRMRRCGEPPDNSCMRPSGRPRNIWVKQPEEEIGLAVVARTEWAALQAAAGPRRTMR